MTICLVARRIWTHGLGGMEEHCRNASAELTRQGHTVHVLTTAHPDGRLTETACGASLHYLPGTPPGDYSPAWWHESRRWARAQFPRLGIDAVLSMSMAAYGLAGATPVPIYPIIVGWGLPQLRGYWFDARGWRRLVEFPRAVVSVLRALPKGRALLRASRCVFPVSRELERQLRGYRVQWIPNYLDTAEFRPDPVARARRRAVLGLTDREPLVLMVGTLTWQKGIHLGLRACAAVARDHPELRVAVVGDGPARAGIEAEVGLTAPHLRVSFAGAQRHAALPDFYAAADLFLLPSLRREGLPTVVLEAMASALPVVATRAGGTPTAVLHEETGLLVPPGDARAIETAIRALLASPERRRALGQAGRARAVATFDQAVVVAQMAAVMSEPRC